MTVADNIAYEIVLSSCITRDGYFEVSDIVDVRNIRNILIDSTYLSDSVFVDAIVGIKTVGISCIVDRKYHKEVFNNILLSEKGTDRIKKLLKASML